MRALVPVLVLLSSHPTAAQEPKNEAGEWRPLFNGKDLEGWTPKIKGFELGDNHADTFRVEDGVLKVSYDKYEQFDNKFGHLFYKEKFSHYRLRVEYRFVGTQCKGGPGWAVRNSGVMFHCQDPKSMRRTRTSPFPSRRNSWAAWARGTARPTTCARRARTW